MNRRYRLYALVEELRARAPGPVRAANLGARFELASTWPQGDVMLRFRTRAKASSILLIAQGQHEIACSGR